MSVAAADCQLLCRLLEPVCQLHETCELLRAYAWSELTAEAASPGVVCECCHILCDCPCHGKADNWSSSDGGRSARGDHKRRTVAEKRQKFSEGRRSSRGGIDSAATFQAEAATTAPEIADADRAAALAAWHARKSAEKRLSRAAASNRMTEEERRRQAEIAKREDGKAAFKSWMKQKKESGWNKRKSDAKSEEEALAEAAQKKVDASLAIDKWRERKDADMAAQRRERQRRQREEEDAKAAEAEENRQMKERALDAWLTKKQEVSRTQAKMRQEAEMSTAETEQQAELEKRESASRAFEAWSARKDAAGSRDSVDGASPEQTARGPVRPWRPNSTVRKKY